MSERTGIPEALPGVGAPGAQERIIAATIEIIERDGIALATTRAIASLAGVNIAAINYYFRSKEALVQTALDASWNNALADLLALVEADSLEPRAMLFSLIDFLVEGQARYPFVTRAHLSVDSPGRARVVRDLHGLVERLVRRIETGLGRESSPADEARTWALLAATLIPAFAPGLSPDLSTEGARREYARLLVSDYLAVFGRESAGGGSPAPIAGARLP